MKCPNGGRCWNTEVNQNIDTKIAEAEKRLMEKITDIVSDMKLFRWALFYAIGLHTVIAIKIFFG